MRSILCAFALVVAAAVCGGCENDEPRECTGCRCDGVCGDCPCRMTTPMGLVERDAGR